jgi:hypothetical protein
MIGLLRFLRVRHATQEQASEKGEYYRDKYFLNHGYASVFEIRHPVLSEFRYFISWSGSLVGEHRAPGIALVTA